MNFGSLLIFYPNQIPIVNVILIKAIIKNEQKNIMFSDPYKGEISLEVFLYSRKHKVS